MIVALLVLILLAILFPRALRFVFGLLISGIIVMAVHSTSAEETAFSLDSHVRTASLFVAIQEECAIYYTVDRNVTHTLIEAAKKSGLQDYGDDFKAAYDAELERRAKEVKITGAKQWCTYQHAYQNTLFKNGSMFKN